MCQVITVDKHLPWISLFYIPWCRPWQAHPDSLLWTETLISPAVWSAVCWVPPGRWGGDSPAQRRAPSQGSMHSVTCYCRGWVPSLSRDNSKGHLITRMPCGMDPGFCYSYCSVQLLQPPDMFTHPHRAVVSKRTPNKTDISFRNCLLKKAPQNTLAVI